MSAYPWLIFRVFGNQAKTREAAVRKLRPPTSAMSVVDARFRRHGKAGACCRVMDVSDTWPDFWFGHRVCCHPFIVALGTDVVL